MTVDKLREVRRAELFFPFTVSLADDRSLHGPSPEFIFAFPKTDRTFIVVGPDGSRSILDFLLVTSIDFPRGKKHPTNGRHR